MGFVRAARKDEIAAGSIREFQLDGLTLAIANVGDKFYAINLRETPDDVIPF